MINFLLAISCYPQFLLENGRQKINSLITRNKVPGYFNYTQPTKIGKNFQLVQVEDLEDASFVPVKSREISDNHCMSCRSKSKSDLPLRSDFGDVNNPYGLIYARLEALQYYKKNNR